MAKAQAPGQAGSERPAAGAELARKAQRQVRWDPWGLLVSWEDSGLSLGIFEESLWLLGAELSVDGPQERKWSSREPLQSSGRAETRRQKNTLGMCSIHVCVCTCSCIGIL